MGVYIWSRLPSEYQEVEYIQSSGTQYIDTGYKYNGTYFRIDFQLMFNSYSYGGTGANIPFICGVIGRSYGNMFMSVGADDRVFGISTGTEMATSLPVQLGIKYDTMLEYKSGTMTFKSNGSTVTTASTGTFYTGKSIPLFCRWDYNGSLYSYFCTDMRMYGCKIYSAENTLSRDFVPCYRKSDNVIGMYDLVNNQFYINSGSGAFTKGSDVDTYRESLLKNAYIGEVWTPGSNTVAYYQLEKDGNDYSGNGHNLTWYGGTPTYTISGGTKKVVNLNGSILGKIANLSGTYTNYTFNVWCKPTNNTTTWQELFDNCKDSSGISTATDNVYINFNGTSYEQASAKDFAYQYRPNGGSNAYQNVYGTTNRGANIWYNVCLTSTSSGVKIYVNGTQIASNSTTGTIILDSGYNYIGGRYRNYNSDYVNRFIGYMSEFIMEDKSRTASEVANYYNSTKANYGIS